MERKEIECLIGLPSITGKRSNTCSLQLSSKKVGNGARIILLWQMDVDFPLKEKAGKGDTAKIYLSI